MDRIAVINTPVAAPGVCCLCGTSGGDDRTFVDFGKQLDWYGAVYFCNFCFTEVSQALNFIPVAKYSELHTEFRELLVKYNQLKARFEVINSALRNGLDNEYIEPSNSPPKPGSLEATEELIRAITNATEGDAEANEPSSLEGSNSVYDNAESNA